MKSDASRSSSTPYDNVSKHIIQQNPEDWIRFALGIPEAKVIEVLDTEQPTVRGHRADSFIHVDILGKEAIMHFEFQTQDSTQVRMPFRIAGYVGRGIETFQKPVYSHVIYLRPTAGRNDPGHYVQDMQGYEITIKYKVLRLQEIDGQAILDAKLKGVIPFAPLMKPPEATDTSEWLRECIRVADTLTLGEPDKPDYLASMAILSGLILDHQTIGEIISEEIMQESSVIQHFTERAIQQGERKGVLESLILILESRFETAEIQTLKPTLESITTLETLKDLRNQALQVSNLETFKGILGSNGS